MSEINLAEEPEFSDDKKQLLKKLPSLESDLTTFVKALKTHVGMRIRGLELGQVPGAVRITGLGENVTVPIFKAKHFNCRYLHKGSQSGIRVIYAYEKDKSRCTLIEIYRKPKNHDRDRILKYYG